MKIQIKPEILVEKDYPWTVESWINSAAYSPGMINSVIHNLGLQEREITEDIYESISKIKSHDPGFAPNDHAEPNPRSYWDIMETIRYWFTGIKVIEEDSTQFTQQIPLFALNSPALRGAKTTYGEFESHENNLGWKIEVLGTGFGADLTLTVTHEGEFTSSAGDRKLIFAPLKVRTVKAALYKRGVFHGNFLKAELAETEIREAHGIRSVSTAEWQELTSSGQVIDSFDLSGDTGGDVAKYKRKYAMKGSFESKLGLKMFDLETSIVAKYVTERAAEVVFELPPGRVYKLWQPSSMPGLYFPS